MNILYLTNKNAENINELPDFIRASGDDVTIYTEKLEINFTEYTKFDFIVSDRYEYIIKKDILSKYNQKNIINLHPSLLPWNKGYHSNFWSIYENTPKGVSIHLIDDGIDTGDIVAQSELTYFDEDTLRTTYKKLRASMVNLFFLNWELIKNRTINYIKQDRNAGTHHYKKEFAILFDKLPDGWDTKISYIKNLKNEKTL